MSERLRVAVLPDFVEEGWPSMDRVADELAHGLARGHAATLQAERIRPPFRHRAARVWDGSLGVKIDRGLNRFLDYPRHLDAHVRRFDIFHVVDHSYAHLVRRLPAERTVVTCHDLDAFRSILQPSEDRGAWPYRALARYLLEGLRRAACITCETQAVRDALVEDVRLSSERIVVVPIGVSGVFTMQPDAGADRSALRLLGSDEGVLEVLHVGGVVPRKRIDVLLDCLADVRRRIPAVRLVHVGEPFNAGQRERMKALGLTDHVVSLSGVDDEVLAAIYRRATLVVVPSEREGFGLPVVEALASGTPVVASDLPVLREVGGPGTTFCPVGDVAAWTRSVVALLGERERTPDQWSDRRLQGARWARRFTWTRFAGDLAGIYHELARAAGRVGRTIPVACPAA